MHIVSNALVGFDPLTDEILEKIRLCSDYCEVERQWMLAFTGSLERDAWASRLKEVAVVEAKKCRDFYEALGCVLRIGETHPAFGAWYKRMTALSVKEAPNCHDFYQALKVYSIIRAHKKSAMLWLERLVELSPDACRKCDSFTMAVHVKRVLSRQPKLSSEWSTLCRVLAVNFAKTLDVSELNEWIKKLDNDEGLKFFLKQKNMR